MGHILTGARVEEESVTSLHQLGSRYVDELGNEWIYLVADEAITGRGYTVAVDNDHGCLMADTTSVAGTIGKRVAVPFIAVQSGYFFWAQIYGNAEVQVAASFAANAKPNVTATGGQLDDDGTVGAETIAGMHVIDTDGGSGGLVTADLNYPFVDATL